MSTNLNNQTNELSPQVDATYIADGSVSNAEFQALDGVTGSIQTTTLANGKIWIGNASNVSNAVTPSGDFTITNTGVGAISSDVIVNSDIKTDAGIEFTKMESLTASKVPVLNASGKIIASSQTATQLTFLDATSSIQTQLNTKISSVAGGDHTTLSNIGTNSHAQIDTHIANTSNPHSVTKAQVGLGNCDNTSDVNKPISTATQTALDAKQATGNYITALTSEVTASGPGSVAATVSNSAVIGKVLTGYTKGAGTVAATDSILQSIQKLDGNDDAKQTRSTITAKGSLYVGTASNTVVEQTVGTNGYVLTADSSVTNGVSYQLPVNQSTWLNNIGLATSVGSSALTIALKTSAGNDPSSTAPVYVAFRNSTLTTGQFSIVAITGALSLVISSGSTLGQRSNIASRIYIYLINNAGTAELAVSRSLIPEETGVVSTTAEGGAGAADSANVMYSTTARSSVAFRLIGTLDNTQTTAGTWTSAGTTLAVTPYVSTAISGVMYKTSAQNPGTTAATKITWESVASAEGGFDPWSICDLANDRLVASRSGPWLVYWSLSAANFDASATIQETIYKNGSGTIRNDYNSGTQGNTRDLKGCEIFDLAINDYLEIFTSSSADSSYSINGVSGLNDSTSRFGMIFIG